MSLTDDEKIKYMALIQSGSHKVDNVIVISEDGFSLDGFTLVEINNGVTCAPGMYYNPKDELFYFDASFTQLTPP